MTPRFYSAEQDQLLVDLYNRGVRLHVIANRVGRSPRSVQVRLWRLRQAGKIGFRCARLRAPDGKFSSGTLRSYRSAELQDFGARA